MTLAIYHVHGTAYTSPYTNEGEAAAIGVCADGKTEAARIVNARILSDGYARFVHVRTERICAAGNWEPGSTLRYS